MVLSYLERTECADAYSNCEDNIKLEPGACNEYPEFAWQSCPSTCGICGTKGRVMNETLYIVSMVKGNLLCDQLI